MGTLHHRSIFTRNDHHCILFIGQQIWLTTVLSFFQVPGHRGRDPPISGADIGAFRSLPISPEFYGWARSVTRSSGRRRRAASGRQR